MNALGAISLILNHYNAGLPAPVATDDKEKNAVPTLEADMDRRDWGFWRKASGYANGTPFDAGWQYDQITFKNGSMAIQLDNEGCPENCSGKPYASGEYRTQQESYGYGYYAARMKAAAGEGLVTSFFTYTGTQGKQDHHEIDFEILGKNCQEAQTNYFTKGKAHEKTIPLGFNACEGFHDYSFRWSKDELVFFVDGKAVRTEKKEIPFRPGRVMANLWPSTAVGWSGRFTYQGPVPIRAQYDWIRFTSEEDLQKPAPPAEPLPLAVSIAGFIEEIATTYKNLFAEKPAAPSGITHAHIVSRRNLSPAARDDEIGYEGPERRSKLKMQKLTRKKNPDRMRNLGIQEDSPTLEHMAEVFAALAFYPPEKFEKRITELNRKGLYERYPVMQHIFTSDEQHDYRFSMYFLDFHEYWNNAIILAAAYVQKCLEENRPDLLEEAFGWLQNFHTYIEQQKEVEDGRKKVKFGRVGIEYNIDTGERELPNEYNLALLNITEAEIRSQIPGRDADFYDTGIKNALEGIRILLSLKNKFVRPSDPDYQLIAKANLIIGDLYQQMAVLTNQPEYYEKAHMIFTDLASVEPGKKGFNLYLDRKPVAWSEIDQALASNVRRGNITEKDREQALVGIGHYLKGIAIIKDVTLTLTQPGMLGTLGIKELLECLAKINEGEKIVRTSQDLSGSTEEANLYFYHLCDLLRGVLLLFLSKMADGNETAVPVTQLAQMAAAGLFGRAAEEFFACIPSRYLDLYARARSQQFEIALRETGKKLNCGKATLAQVETLRDKICGEESLLGDYGIYQDQVISVWGLVVQAAVREKDADTLEEAQKETEKLNIKFIALREELKTEDVVTRRKRMPSDYSLAKLDLLIGEIYARTENKDESFYLAGAAFCTSGLNKMFSLPEKQPEPPEVKVIPAEPDYFSIVVGIIVLADTYSRLFNMTSKQEYARKAEEYYRSAATIEQSEKGVAVKLDQYPERYVSPAAINKSLDMNIQRGYLMPADKTEAEISIYHYLRGVALIKNAAQFVSWPKKKTLPEILDQLNAVRTGMKVIETATSVMRETDPERNRFLLEQATLIQGELLLAAADRISFSEDEYTIFYEETIRQVSQADPGCALSEAIELPKREMIGWLISVAENKFMEVKEKEADPSTRIPYLYVMARIKLFAIKMRRADFIIYINKKGEKVERTSKGSIKIMDVGPIRGELAEIQKELNQLPTEQYLLSNNRPSYFQIELAYYYLSLSLNGTPQKDENGNITIKNPKTNAVSILLDPDDAVDIIENGVLQNLASLSDTAREYFSWMSRQKMADATLQRALLSKENQDRSRALALEALASFKLIEKWMGLPLPSHLYYQVEHLPWLLSEKKDPKEAGKVIDALLHLARGRVDKTKLSSKDWESAQKAGLIDKEGYLQDKYYRISAGAPSVQAASAPKLNEDLDRNNPLFWQAADGWTNGNPFNNGWRADHVSFSNGLMTLQLDNNGCPQACSGKPYASGEYRTQEFYGYGLLEARFKPARADGTVSSLFFYTGPSDKNPWDEIDIEFLGKDPTRMQINYYTNGRGNHEKMIDLEFDASQGFHTYGIRRGKDSITWYVDEKPIHTETGTRGPLPAHPGRIMANLWPSTAVSWSGEFDYQGQVQAQYDWIRFNPEEIAPEAAKSEKEPPSAPADLLALLRLAHQETELDDLIVPALDLKEKLKTINQPGAFTEAISLSQTLIARLKEKDASSEFYQFAELLSLDIHNFRADLYQLLALAHGLLKEGELAYEYTVSAYYEASQSDLPYNQKIRKNNIWTQTGIKPKELDPFLMMYKIAPVPKEKE